jgi:hypothetical protein
MIMGMTIRMRTVSLDMCMGRGAARTAGMIITITRTITAMAMSTQLMGTHHHATISPRGFATTLRSARSRCRASIRWSRRSC